MIADEMRNRLEALRPERLEIVDDSESHRGHAGFREGGESHFHIRMTAAAFAGLSRIERHRLVHRTLGDIVPRIHALSLDLAEA
ncbi:MAG: BolA family protein [Paracoccus sp. (in: a-proteobacteria)]|jgi:BolA protein|uniref:BolA family protein n=1 Tax=unclassified Paracoccus (in: a-proteobacteria) TaxID=2688777 RepID=UPI000C55E4BD|nr:MULTISPECIES: BolA family protein [unclassified Paracoccus (in: a-proteobacteria)]MAN55998.1 BolA family transcriptional regulator [Paracoccus sp. (in: a-proteobacteria)]MBA47680.1 BolA family transcriptional regulator [Paracoccus sp. (in: a-proteobacteria)]MCS5600623.1 BolA family transcriptional regulator [Paracoccus sp. (in: a-proteobacteria)]HIC65039.1 BolA family transcriptional regulator [Paracoccus sp. (in: a-proteobacteria)]|tara:strand:- start:7645 stop:7896 length:252 start_codon:yes stop_codon:yes gene_type:complete